jgi:Ala-tRNA(Pro) deacylase
MTFDVTKRLAANDVAYELIHHRHTKTAGEEAAVLGVGRDDVAKTVVLVTEQGFVRAVVRASDRLDVDKARLAVGTGDETRLASERELVGAYPMFELGAVPPFGGPDHDQVVVDSQLAARDSVIIEAGSHDESVRVAVADLLKLADAVVADIART